MESRYKAYLKLNLMSIFFIAVSFISVSLAWFAYSGLSNVATEIDVKTWFVEFQKDNAPVSNNIVISLSEIYPGMETVHETVKIQNKGDSDATLNYNITSARILDESLSSEVYPKEFIVDKLSNVYPFKINISLSKTFLASGGDTSVFDVSISWPLDSGNDEIDSSWGRESYLFQENEQNKLNADSSYQVKPSVKIVIAVKAEQFIESEESTDIKYNLGDTLLYDVSSNTKCNQLGGTCLKTHIIDINNQNDEVTLLPDLYNTYSSGVYNNYQSLLQETTKNWNVITKPLTISNLLNVVSNDVMNSLIIRETISDSILGNVSYNNRVDEVVAKTVDSKYNGYFTFLNERFNYLATNKCYWINNEYNSDKAFALTKIDDVKSKIYGEIKTSNCSAIPTIVIEKSKLVEEKPSE